MPTYDELLDDALLAASRGRTAEREAIERLKLAYPDEPGGFALETLTVLWRGELEEARRLAEGLGRRPAELAVQAEVMGYEGDREGAAERLEKALSEAPDDPIVLRSAYSVFSVDDAARSLALARRRVELRPHDPMVYGSLGTSLLAGSVAEAERLANEPPPAFADTSAHRLLLARLAMKRHDLAAAETYAREAVAANADSYMAWATLSDILRFLGRKDEAEQTARFSLELNRRNPLALRGLAALAAGRGDRQEADRLEREAQEAIPALAFLSAYRTAKRLVKEQKRPEALDALAPLLRFKGHPRSTARQLRLNLLIGMEDDAALRTEVEAAGQEGADAATLLRARGELERRSGRLDEARRLLESAETERPGTALADLIRVFAARDDREAIRARLAEVPGAPGDAANVVLALDKAGLKEEAVEFLARAQRRYPEAQTLQLLRVGTLAAAGNVPGMLHAMRDLDAEHRPRIRLKMSPWKLVRLLWRRARRPKGR